MKSLIKRVKMKFFRKKTKVFCIGQNKTGTTSIEAVLKLLDYQMGNQAVGEALVTEWGDRDFKNIIKLVKSADAFQDVPFSNNFTYIILDYVFPKSKFILTVRDDKDTWYNSLTRFHTKLLKTDGLPTVDDLKKFPYRYKGWLWDGNRLKFGIDESELYDYKIYTDHYESYNNTVKEYFYHRPNDLLIINLKDKDVMKRLYKFLDIPYNGEELPHLNASK
jgi:hypothetical protein